MEIGFALCGSFCTFHRVFPVMEALTASHHVIPILSQSVQTVDSRFGTAGDHLQQIRELTGEAPLCDLAAVEPIGPKHLLDALIIAPCTGNTLAKLAGGIADGPVTMAAKSHLRNGRPVILAVSTNDALGASAENIGRLLVRKNIYFVPFGQDDPVKKPTSMVAVFERIPEALAFAMEGKQLQPILY